MANRIIRGDLLDSEGYGSVSDSGRLFFIHLCLLADDLGCVSLAPVFLRRRAFIRHTEHSEIDFLLSMLHDVDLLRIYEVDKARYGFIPKFRQRLQRMTIKHPQPPLGLYQDDAYALQQFNKINGLMENPTVAQQMPNGSPSPEEKRREEKRSRREEKIERGTRLQVEQLPDEWKAWCVAQAPRLNPDDVFQKFRDYWIGVSGSRGVKRDWFATWRNFCRNERPATQFKQTLSPAEQRRQAYIEANYGPQTATIDMDSGAISETGCAVWPPEDGNRLGVD